MKIAKFLLLTASSLCVIILIGSLIAEIWIDSPYIGKIGLTAITLLFPLMILLGVLISKEQ